VIIAELCAERRDRMNKRSIRLPMGAKNISGPAQKSPTLQIAVNRNIRAKQVRLCDEKSKILGVFDVESALALASRNEKDIVQIIGTREPPTCILIDYGRFRFLCRHGRLPKKWLS
jgi:hypothetical protein